MSYSTSSIGPAHIPRPFKSNPNQFQIAVGYAVGYHGLGDKIRVFRKGVVVEIDPVTSDEQEAMKARASAASQPEDWPGLKLTRTSRSFWLPNGHRNNRSNRRRFSYARF